MSIITVTHYEADHIIPFIQSHATLTEAIQTATIGSAGSLVRMVEVGWEGHIIASYRNGNETIVTYSQLAA